MKKWRVINLLNLDRPEMKIDFGRDGNKFNLFSFHEENWNKKKLKFK